MNLLGESAKLKIIIGENDIVYNRPLYEAIVFAAKKYKLSGATVTKGILSFGAQSIHQSVKIFSLSKHPPIIVEIIDYKDRLTDFAEIVKKLMIKAKAGGIISMEDTEVLYYSKDQH